MSRRNACSEAREKLRRFLEDASLGRVFEWPIDHPSQPTGFCPCDDSAFKVCWFYLKATILLWLLKLPANHLKIAYLRWLGAKVGKRVYLSVDVWIDPAFPQLLAIEDDVMVGVGVKISMHEFGRNHFRAGRVIVRRGAVLGGFSLIGPGVEIGADAVVAGAAAVGRDVPPGKMAVGNPARIFPMPEAGVPEEPSLENGKPH